MKAGISGTIAPQARAHHRQAGRLLPLCVALAVVVVLFPACRRRQQHVFAVIPKSQAHIFWQAVHAGAASAAREAQVAIEWNGPGIVIRDSDTQTGVWAGGGVIFRMGKGFNLGLNARYSKANLQFKDFGGKVVGDTHYGFMIGWGWQ